MGVRPTVCAGAVAVLVCLLAWFAAEVVTGAGQAHVAERILAVAQAVWRADGSPVLPPLRLSQRTARTIIANADVILMFMAIAVYGGYVLTGVVEE